MDDNTTVADTPDDNVLLNDQSLVYGSDMQMDPAEENDGSWHIRSTPPYSNGPYPG